MVRRSLTALVAIAALAGATPAHAGKRQLRMFEDDRLLLYSGPVVRAATLDTAKRMGVDVVRAQFVWRNIALSKPKNPSDPNSYGTNWSNWDSLVLEAHKRGIKVLATVTGPAPSWAAGKTSNFFTGSRYPNAKAFGEFMTAVGRRYSGQAKASISAAAAGGQTPYRAVGGQTPYTGVSFTSVGGLTPSGAGGSARAAQLIDPLPIDPVPVGPVPVEPISCTPIPPLITCDPNGTPVPVVPPPPGGGDGGGGGGGSGGGSSSPPPSSGEQSPPPPPGSGEPTPPPPPGTTLPRISLWSIYNEPNHPLFLSPQRRNGVLVAPSLYRKLYRAGWNALARTGHARDTVLIGETLPIGTNQARETSTTSPLIFARELFCLNGKGKRHPGCSGRFAKLHASGWALHPYYRKTGPFSQPPGPNDLTPATVGRLRTLLAKAGRKGRVSRGLGIWDTENGSQTRPPDPKGASLSGQARFINEAEYLAWRTPYVRTFSQYLLLDDQPVWAFQSGLLFDNGRPKPSLAAYELPIYVKKAGRGVLVWGHVPPGGDGNLTIHPSAGRDVVVRVPRSGGYFTKRLRTRAPSYVLRYGSLRSRGASPH